MLRAISSVAGLTLATGLILGCSHCEQKTAVKPEPVDMSQVPVVVNPTQTDITGDPSGAGGYKLSKMPMPRYVERDGKLYLYEVNAGEPVIVPPERVKVVTPDELPGH